MCCGNDVMVVAFGRSTTGAEDVMCCGNDVMVVASGRSTTGAEDVMCCGNDEQGRGNDVECLRSGGEELANRSKGTT